MISVITKKMTKSEENWKKGGKKKKSTDSNEDSQDY